MKKTLSEFIEGFRAQYAGIPPTCEDEGKFLYEEGYKSCELLSALWLVHNDENHVHAVIGQYNRIVIETFRATAGVAFIVSDDGVIHVEDEEDFYRWCDGE